MARQMCRGLGPIAVAAMLVAALVAAWSCAPGQAQSLPDTELERVEFALENARYQILLPRNSRLEPMSEPGCIKLWHPRSTRSMTFLQLCSAASATPDAFARQATLSNGARVRYTVDHDIGGGSGGMEGELTGQLDFDGRVFALTCRDQADGRSVPNWCLHYLSYLQVKERK